MSTLYKNYKVLLNSNIPSFFIDKSKL